MLWRNKKKQIKQGNQSSLSTNIVNNGQRKQLQESIIEFVTRSDTQYDDLIKIMDCIVQIESIPFSTKDDLPTLSHDTKDNKKKIKKKCNLSLKQFNSFNFLDFPVDVLSNIFLYIKLQTLLSLAQINSQWRTLINSPIAWQHVHMPATLCTRLSNVTLAYLARQFGPYTKIMDLSGCIDLQDDSLYYLFVNCKVLEWISLARCFRISDKSLINLSYSPCSGKIRHLNLTKCESITDAGLEKLSNHILSLTFLDLTDCEEVTEVSLHHIANGLSKLSTLNLTGCHEIRDNGVVQINKNCTLLTTFNLSHCQLLTDNVTDSFSRLKFLENLVLRNCHLLTDVGIAALSKTTSLTSLDITGCQRLTDVGMAALANGCFGDKLLSLQMAWCINIGDDGITSICNSCPSLQFLNVSHCNKITDFSLLDLSKLGKINNLGKKNK